MIFNRVLNDIPLQVKTLNLLINPRSNALVKMHYVASTANSFRLRVATHSENLAFILLLWHTPMILTCHKKLCVEGLKSLFIKKSLYHDPLKSPPLHE